MRAPKRIRALIKRKSFATVIPSVAFACGFLLALLFTSLYFIRANTVYMGQAEAMAERLAHVVEDHMQAGDLDRASAYVERLAPGHAVLLSEARAPIAGRIDDAFKGRTAVQPIMVGDQRFGFIRAAPPVPYTPPMPYFYAVFLILLIAALAAFVMRFFSNLAAMYLTEVNTVVDSFSLKKPKAFAKRDMLFKEFRNLKYVTIQTTKRLTREIRDLRQSAERDDMTGLGNQVRLEKALGKALQTQGSQAVSAFLLLVYETRDAPGDIATARLTQAVGEALQAFTQDQMDAKSAFGQPWTLTKLFGEQFGLVVTGVTGRDDMAAIIRDMRAHFRGLKLAVGDREVSVAFRGAIVMLPDDADTVARARSRADIALQDLLRQDERAFAFYSPKLERQRDARRRLEAELSEAVRTDAFIPLFQPKVDLASGYICGAEALARWRLPNGRLVSPSVFIELAEETGQISRIGAQIMRKACLEAVQWTQFGQPVSLAVNVSPRQFERAGLDQMVLDALAKSGLPPRLLEIEITESLAIQQPEKVASVVAPLKALGIKLAVDDFGTGHSNLATLTKHAFDVFKVDRQFVSGTPDDAQANAIVEMMLGMGNTLNLQIVGEGIETQEQAEFLAEHGCHIGQGYLYSPPVTGQAFLKMLREQPFVKRPISA